MRVIALGFQQNCKTFPFPMGFDSFEIPQYSSHQNSKPFHLLSWIYLLIFCIYLTQLKSNPISRLFLLFHFLSLFSIFDGPSSSLYIYQLLVVGLLIDYYWVSTDYVWLCVLGFWRFWFGASIVIMFSHYRFGFFFAGFYFFFIPSVCSANFSLFVWGFWGLGPIFYSQYT